MNQNQCCIKLESGTTRTTQLFMRITLVAALVSSLVLAQTAIAQEILVQTGFEEFTLGKPPNDWEAVGDKFEVTNEIVKTDKKSLGILGGANDERVSVAIETENPVISVEFWAYITGGGRSFNFRVVSNDDTRINDGGVYLNWDANAVRLYDGAAWQPIEDFDTDTWQYVRVVADVDKSEFEFYAGNDRDDALKAKGEKGLPFRNAAQNPVAKWVSFHVYTIAAPGYVDDLLVYEGAEPLNLAVDPNGKLATVWGHIKRHSSFQ